MTERVRMESSRAVVGPNQTTRPRAATKSPEQPAAAPCDGVALGSEAKVGESPYSWSTASAARLMAEAPAGSEAELLAKVHTGEESFLEARRELEQKLRRGLKRLETRGVDVAEARALLERPNAATPRRLYDQLHGLLQLHPGEKQLATLRGAAGLWQALEDFSRIKSDGLVRTAEHYLSPGHLTLAMAARGWEVDPQTGLSIADAVVIGGGPGGLATTYHLAEDGRRVVLLEGNKFGQAFSDAHAQSVHQLRTSGDTSNLIYTGSATQLGVEVSLPRQLETTRPKCETARSEWSQATGEPQQGYSPGAPGERTAPANRSELFDHMAQLAAGLSQHYPDTLVSENSPVRTIEKLERGDQTLFRVTGEKGHTVLARSLVMATGFVGGDGENARCLQAFGQAKSALVLCNDNDLFSQGESLLKLERSLQDGRLTKNLVMSERMLGHPELRELVKKLPEGARVGVIGGGESASKGALEVLALNPGITLDLYTSDPLEPYQTQIPTSVIHPAVVEKALKEPEVAKKTWAETERFETPITPATMAELLKAEGEGRVRIRELGARFSEKTVEIRSGRTERGQTLRLSLKDPAVAERLTAQRQSWVDKGLYGDQPPSDDPSQLPATDLFLIAAGYDRKAIQAGPLIQQLVQAEVVEFGAQGEPLLSESGLVSAKHPMVAFNTAAVAQQPADSAVPGRAIRGYRLAQELATRLPAREKPSDRIATGLPFQGVDTTTPREENLKPTEWVMDFLEQEGMSSTQIAAREAQIAAIADLAERAKAALRWDIERRFPVANGPIRELLIKAAEQPDSLTPVEKLMVERARGLSQRIYQPAPLPNPANDR